MGEELQRNTKCSGRSVAGRGREGEDARETGARLREASVKACVEFRGQTRGSVVWLNRNTGDTP